MSLDNAREENSHIWERQHHDHYVEPLWCSARLFEEEEFTGPIFDPCCGFGHIVQSAIAAGYETRAADVVDRGYPLTEVRNFLDPRGAESDIVCNPPFDQFRPFAELALRTARGKVAMIWLVRTLPAARWLSDTPLARIWLLTPRPSMPPGEVIARGEKPGGGKQDFCWLVWDKNHSGKPTVDWLRRAA